MRPPQALVEFGIVEPDTIWRLWKAVYGLRISPKAWGQERDREMKKMVVTIGGKPHWLCQSPIDPSVWTIVSGEPPTTQVAADPDPETVRGWIVVYVDDFLTIGPDDVINGATEAINSKWKCFEKRHPPVWLQFERRIPQC